MTQTNPSAIPLTRIAPLLPFRSVYLAGKITKNGWRSDLVPAESLRVFSGCPDGPSLAEVRWPVLARGVCEAFDFTGPYFIGCDHGCFHGRNSHGVGAQKSRWEHGGRGQEVVRLCLEGIRRADLVFAWLDDVSAYGTLGELGYARGLGKTIWVAGPRELPDLWFTVQTADATCFTEPTAARAFSEMCLRALLD